MLIKRKNEQSTVDFKKKDDTENIEDTKICS